MSTLEKYSNIKMDPWMDLEVIMSSDISQFRKDIHCMIVFTCGISRKSSHDVKSRTMRPGREREGEDKEGCQPSSEEPRKSL